MLHRNMLVPIVHPEKELMELESDDTYYDTPPPDNDLPDLVPRGPVACSQTKARILAQGLTGAVTRVFSYIPR